MVYTALRGKALFGTLHRYINKKQFSTRLIPGRATPYGTENFLKRSDLPLFHRFDYSGLYINPIIHGPPSKPHVSDSGEDIKTTEYYEAMTKRAVFKNRSNCMIVYQHNHNVYTQEPWHMSNISNIISTRNDGTEQIKREEIVTIADLGYATNQMEIYRRLSEACRLTGLEQIDAAYFEINETIMDTQVYLLSESVDTMQSLCHSNKLQFFGIRISVAPFIYHTPAFRSSGHLAMLPNFIENQIRDDSIAHAELIIYQVSPTTSIPATYPMLDPNKATTWDESTIGEESMEMKRKYTRASIDPLICYRGAGKEGAGFDLHSIETQAGLAAEVMERQKVVKVDKDIPKEGTEGYEEDEEDDDDDEEEEEEDGADDSPLVSEVKTYPENEECHERYTYGGLTEWYMISGVIPPPVDGMVAQALDELCPALQSTPNLQDKALRVVFSVGIDVCILDTEVSALMGKLTLRPEDMLHSDSTDGVFGAFTVPSNAEMQER